MGCCLRLLPEMWFRDEGCLSCVWGFEIKSVLSALSPQALEQYDIALKS